MQAIEVDVVENTTIYVTEVDRKRLERLIEFGEQRDGKANREYLRKLEDELERAVTVDPQDLPADVITMRSKARLCDMKTGDKVVYTLVFPVEADYKIGKISVLAPVGTAMLGYREGSIIEWPVPSGMRRLRVEEVIYQPEAAGDHNL